MSMAESLLVIVGLAVVTLLCRSLFLLPDRDLPFPAWLREGLRYAPLAALIAVVVPEIVMVDGQLVDTLRDSRLFGAAAGLAAYVWRRNILGTIAIGTGVMLALRFLLHWQ